MKPRLIESRGRDMRFYAGPANAGIRDALTINPAAAPRLVYSAAASKVADIRALTAPLAQLSDDLAESIPPTVMRDFIDAIQGIACTAESLLRHAAELQRYGDAALATPVQVPVTGG